MAPLSDALPSFRFLVGHTIEGLQWQVETTTNLNEANWSVVPAGNMYAWRDTGVATEYLANPTQTNAPQCFGRLVILPN